jgi:hypothetical protein
MSTPHPRGDFVEAYRFATGHDPPRALLSIACEGTLAERRVRRPGRNEGRPFTVCTRHADLLWLLGLLSLEGDAQLRSWVAEHAADLDPGSAAPTPEG